MRHPGLKIATTFFLTLLTVLSFSQPYKSSERVNFLKNLNGQYPFDVNLLGNPVMKSGLKKLTMDRFTFLKKNFNTQMPIVILNNYFIAEACKAHECGFTEFIITVDLTNDVLYVGIRDEGKIQTFSEDKGLDPEPIRHWSEPWYNK
jgi:hypothetical protein